MGLTRLAITRPIAIVMLIGAMLALGIVSYTRLKVDRFPAISFPFVSVSVSYPGASAEDMEELVVTVLEDVVSGAPNVQSISSISADGFGSVNIALAEGTDANIAAVDIERRVAGARGRLPADATSPTVSKADPQAFPIMNVAFSGRRSLEELYDYATDVVQPRLQSVPGVAGVNLSGGLAREIQIKADPKRLAAHGLSASAITSALQRENVSSPGGAARQEFTQVNIRTVGLFRSVAEVRNLIVAQGQGATVTLGQVAEVREAIREQTRVQRFNGGDTIGFSIVKQADANAIQVADAVRANLARLRTQVPADTTFTVTNDSTRFTRAAVEAVEFDLALAVAITAIVLLLFLHAWRSTVIVLLAIPTSIIVTFLFMFIMGFTINTISLLALALMIGILVDDSIVVLENIIRHLHLGEEPRQAALLGRSEIGLAAIAITLVDVVVFVPLAFMPGNLGQLFREFGFIIAAATLMSLFVSFTLTPMLASRWLRPVVPGAAGRGLGARFERAWERFYDRLGAGYHFLLARALRVRWLVLLLGIGIFAYSLAMAGVFGERLGPVPLRLLGTEYAPSEDDNQISLNLEMPAGTSLPAMTQAVVRFETLLKERVPEIDALFTSIGAGGFGGRTSPNTASIAVQLRDKRERQRHGQRSVFEVLNVVRRDLGRAVPGLTVRGSVASAFAGGGGGGIAMRVQGESLATLIHLSDRVQEVARAVPGVVDVRSSLNLGNDEIQVVPDRARMADRGVTSQQLATAVRAAIEGTVVSVLRPGDGPQRDIRLFTASQVRPDPAVIRALPVAFVNGTMVTVGDVATIALDKAPVQIDRTDRLRVLTVSAAVQGRPLGDAANEVRAAVNRQVEVPANYRITFAGQISQLDNALLALGQVLLLSVILIYMLLAALYESWLQPFVIMFSLPVALIGAFTALVITGNTLNIFSVLGIILLFGLVAKNGILLVDYANTLRERGETLRAAVLGSARVRLRPILMTSVTIVFAMIPLALKLEDGAESRAPLAVAIIGGVLSSLVLTLFLVPSVYTILDDLAEGARRALARWRQPRTAPALAATGPAATPPVGNAAETSASD